MQTELYRVSQNSRVVMEQALDELSVQVAYLSDQSYRKYLLYSRQIERKLQGRYTVSALVMYDTYLTQCRWRFLAGSAF